MSQEKIAIKDVTPPSGHTSAPNPQTHKGKADRFNPNNRIYVRAVKGVYQQLRRRMGWLLMALFMGLPWIPYATGKPFCWISHSNSSIFSAPPSGRKISPCSPPCL